MNSVTLSLADSSESKNNTCKEANSSEVSNADYNAYNIEEVVESYIPSSQQDRSNRSIELYNDDQNQNISYGSHKVNELDKTKQNSPQAQEELSLLVREAASDSFHSSFSIKPASATNKAQNSFRISDELHDYFIDRSVLGSRSKQSHEITDDSSIGIKQKTGSSMIQKYSNRIQELNATKDVDNRNTNNQAKKSSWDLGSSTISKHFKSNKISPHFSLTNTEPSKSNKEDEIVVLEVQKQPIPGSLSGYRANYLKMQNKMSISKPKSNSFGGNLRAMQQESDKFLEPLLISINQLQHEKNKIQSEYQMLLAKHSKTVSYLEKSLTTTNTLQKRINVLVQVQEEVREEVKEINENKTLAQKIKDVKSSGISIKQDIESITTSFKSLQIQKNTITEKLNDINAKQTECKLKIFLNFIFN